MSRIQKSKAYLAAVFLAVFAFSTVVSILPAQKAYAQSWPGGNFIADEVYDNASGHQHYYWLYSCFRSTDIEDVNHSEMDNWDFFEGEHGEAVLGAMYPGDSSENISGYRSCEEGSLIEAAFEKLGFDNPKKVFCDLEGSRYEDDGDSYDACVQGPGDHNWDNDEGDRAKVADSFKEMALSKKPPFGGAEEYVRAYKTLLSAQGCEIEIADDATLYNSHNEVPGIDGSNIEYGVPVFVPNGAGTGYILRWVKGVSDKASGHELGYVATESYAGGNLGGYQRKSCGEVAGIARNNAEAYGRWLQEHADAPGDNDGTNGGGETEPSCESEGGPGAWFMCWVIEAIDRFISILDRQIQSLLYIDKDVYDNDTIDEAWGTMRNLALLILVPMMMFMVIGTALNFGPFDPYTVKKALPRMFVAVIFIVLSLPVTQFGIQLSNAVGQGLGNIIISASPQDVRYLSDVFSEADGNSQETLGWITIVAGIGGWAIGAAGALISFGLVAIVGLLIGFCTLVLRQVLLILLIVIAPLAILAWIFPGNDKLWGLWKGTFIAMLLMYPIIAMLLASGKFVAGILG